MSAVVELLQELIRIPSVNPQGDPGTPHTGEGEIAKFIGDYLLKLGMEVEMQFVEKDRPTVIGRLKSKTSRKHILLGPHTDTVSVVGMTIEPFGGVLKDGRVWGRGASDTKGSMSAMLVALKEMVEQKKCPPDTDFWFAGLMGEESGNDGIEYLMKSDYFKKKDILPSFGIAGEPTDLRIVHRHKGAYWLRLRTRGRSCHASRPDLGENAIMKMRHAMEFITNEMPKSYAHLEDPLLGKATFSVTGIKGGSKVNIIPELCEIEVDHRSLPKQTHGEVMERLRKSLPECEVEVISDRPGLNTPADDPYIQRLADVLGRHSPGKSRGDFLTGAPWFADCSLMAGGGVPAIAFGPGSISQAHTKDEFIEIAELEKCVDVLRDFFTGLD